MNILVVDDSATNRKLLRINLEPEGHTVLEAADGKEALTLLGSHPVDAVISDILMPNMDGYRFCHELRRNQNFKHIAFIHYTSTYTSPGYQKLSQETGADDYLTKPASPQTILNALNRAVAQSEERKRSELERSDTVFVMKQYSETLVNKLEEKNTELERAAIELAKANESVVRLNDDLERRIDERTNELRAANLRLTRSNDEIQSFYHTLSHELKTPLTSAREFVAILLDGLAGPLNETQTEYLGLARESCDQMRIFLNDLLDSTRMDTGKFTLDLKSCSLEELVAKVMARSSPVATRKQITLSSNLRAGLPEVRVDPIRVKQVLTNLVNNAVKFTAAGGRIEITADESPEGAGFVRVSVTDTGRGIPAEELERVFDRLYQVKRGDAATEQGMGLGLYLCRQLVELHGGRIRAESEVEKGSTFTFTLPKAPAEERGSASEPAQGARG